MTVSPEFTPTGDVDQGSFTLPFLYNLYLEMVIEAVLFAYENSDIVICSI